MNHFFIEKFQVPPMIENVANQLLLDGMKPLFDKFEELLAIDVYLYSAMLKTKLISESGAYELIEIELNIMEDLINQNPTTHKGFRKNNKKALRLLTEHYNNLLNAPMSNSDYLILYDVMWSLNVDIGQIYILLSIIHMTIVLDTYEGINLSLAIDKVFNKVNDTDNTEGLYV